MTLFLALMAAMEWWRSYFPYGPQPVLCTAGALLAAAYAVCRIWRARPQLKALRLASKGEQAVGQFLERLREQGYQVFNDVLGPGFNIDQILIGPAGVLTIETKTRSRGDHPNTKVTFDGEKLVVGGLAPDRDPIVQAKAQASWLKTLLAESTGRKFGVRPVILFPGWFVEQGKGTTRELWALNPRALPEFLANEPQSLSAEDVKLAAFHLSRFIRAQEQQKAKN